jgi:hypothetical protein
MDEQRRKLLDRVKREVAILQNRVSNVRIQELNNIANQFKRLGVVAEGEPTSHGVLFQMGESVVHVATHNRGHSQLKPVYVKNFIAAALENIDILEDEDEDGPKRRP